MAFKLQSPIIRAEAQGNPPEKLASISIQDLFWSGPEDDIIKRLGLRAYKEMSRDDEVSGDIDHRLTLMMPGIQVLPTSSDDKAKRLADLVEGVLTEMPGSTLSILRDQMLREAVTTGFVVAEPVWDTVRVSGFGNVRGLVGLKVRPSEFFIPNGIKRDIYGNIEHFKEVSGGNHGMALPEDVIYYAFKGSPNNPYGMSVLHPVYNPWKYKQKVERLYITFAAINASGLRSAEIPPEDAADLDKLNAANEAMRDLAEAGSFAHSSAWKLKIDVPPGTAGQHFRLYIEHLNRAIRMAILGDQNFNAQDTTIGTQASRTVSMTVVTQRMRAEGQAYAETLSEQLSRRIIEENGFVNDPYPWLIPEQRFKDDADLVTAMKAMNEALKAGTITRGLNDETQDQVITKLFIDVGVDAKLGGEAIVPTAPTPSVQAAAAPAGRRPSDIRKQGKEYDKLFVSSVDDYQTAWAELWPLVSAKVEAAVFNPKGNGWKATNSSDIRKAVSNNIRYKSGDMRKALEVVLVDGLKVGKDHAQQMTGVKAVVSTQPPQVSEGTLEVTIGDRSYFMNEDEYASLEKTVYLFLMNAKRGGTAPQIAQRDLRQLLEKEGIGAGSNAVRLIDTSLTTVYNESRMNVFRGLINPVGTTADTIPGFVYSAVLDANTTDICTGYDGMAFKSDDPFMPQPPIHFNCRSVLIPVFGNEVPWTTESGGSYTDFSESQKLAADIPSGFGGQ